jgi:MFS family permease
MLGLASAALIATGITVAGFVDVVPLWIIAFGLTGVGAGAGYTGSAGVLFESVGSERIVTAMIVWSQLGIIGYLLGPLAGGVVAQGLGFTAIGLVPAAPAVLVLATYVMARRAIDRVSAGRSSSLSATRRLDTGT